jgi:hypothetical protein
MAIQFSAAAHAIVIAFESKPDEEKSGSYWDSDAVELVRREAKQHYIQQQGHRCCYCDFILLTKHGRAWDVEHIVARSTHPQFLFEPENLAVACIDCNIAKRDKPVLHSPRRKRYPRNFEAYRLCHPHYDRLEDHLVILFDRFFIPKTAKGRETIEICGLLRYAYEYAEWNQGLADNTKLQEAFNRAMNATEPAAQTLAMMEALVIVGLRVVR